MQLTLSQQLEAIIPETITVTVKALLSWHWQVSKVASNKGSGWVLPGESNIETQPTRA